MAEPCRVYLKEPPRWNFLPRPLGAQFFDAVRSKLKRKPQVDSLLGIKGSFDAALGPKSAPLSAQLNLQIVSLPSSGARGGDGGQL